MSSDRLSQIEKSLKRLREQVAGKEDTLTTIAPEERVRIKQQISDLKAEIKPFEEEYWQILTERATAVDIVDAEAEVVVVEIMERVEPLQRSSQYSPEVLDLLQKIYSEVSKPGAPAAAKLKGALSWLPPFVSLSYEAEIDTENFLRTNFPTFREWARALAKK
jgi:DNA repair exonuclease SbcCD ATPase subunit